MDYPVEKVNAPTYIYIATEDALVSRYVSWKYFLLSSNWSVSLQDVEHLAGILPNVKKFQVIKNWNHVDFTYGRNTRKVLYKGILADMLSADYE